MSETIGASFYDFSRRSHETRPEREPTSEGSEPEVAPGKSMVTSLTTTTAAVEVFRVAAGMHGEVSFRVTGAGQPYPEDATRTIPRGLVHVEIGAHDLVSDRRYQTHLAAQRVSRNPDPLPQRTR